MKPEKEFKYMAILLSSKYVRDRWNLQFRPEPASRKDFEILCGTWEKDKEFYLWLNELIEEGSLEFYEKDKTHGNKKYIVNSSILMKRFKNHPIYQYVRNCFFLEK